MYFRLLTVHIVHNSAGSNNTVVYYFVALQKKFEDQETDLNKKNAELETLLRQVEALYASISEKEKKIRRC